MLRPETTEIVNEPISYRLADFPTASGEISNAKANVFDHNLISIIS